ncbi:hypothetical protein J2772_000068 [Chryseobacterium jejuense]|nr:hypothetical protein [Chryseobacterium jejuense]
MISQIGTLDLKPLFPWGIEEFYYIFAQYLVQGIGFFLFSSTNF